MFEVDPVDPAATPLPQQHPLLHALYLAVCVQTGRFQYSYSKHPFCNCSWTEAI